MVMIMLLQLGSPSKYARSLSNPGPGSKGTDLPRGSKVVPLRFWPLFCLLSYILPKKDLHAAFRLYCELESLLLRFGECDLLMKE